VSVELGLVDLSGSLIEVLPQSDTSDGYDEHSAGVRCSERDDSAKRVEGFRDFVGRVLRYGSVFSLASFVFCSSLCITNNLSPPS